MREVIICPICGTENRKGTKYCRICFSRLYQYKKKAFPLKTNFPSQVYKHKNVFTFIFIFLLFFLIWILLK